jgi:peptidyl-prolyl cis-trans isomerase SurA
MMQVVKTFRVWIALIGVCVGATLCASAYAQPASGGTARQATPAKTAAGGSERDADTIVAVVNKEVITRRELDARLRLAKRDMAAQRIQMPPDNVLEPQVLQRLITEKLELQEGRRLNIQITPAMIDAAIETIAKRNNATVAQIRQQLQASGVPWSDYENLIRRELLLERLRQTVVDRTILITDAEVDAFLREQKAREAGGLPAVRPTPAPAPPPPPPPKPKAVQPAIMGIAQILVRVPEGSSPDEVAVLRKKAQDLLARVRKGESFESVAKASSDGPEASLGGDLGVRPLNGWPDLFLKAVANVPDGRISNIIQSPNGFHILKVVGRAGGEPPPQAQQAPPPPAPTGPDTQLPKGPMPVQQTQARHILLKSSAVMTDDVARQRLADIRQRIVQGGESFSDLAKRFSNDASAPQGGDLGWLNPGETVPPFEKAMNTLKIGEVSAPVQSQFGWHLILVEGRRTQDMADQFLRNQVRQRLFIQRSEAEFDAWLQRVRNQSYIDNRLEKTERLNRN